MMAGVMRFGGSARSLSPREHQIAELISHGLTDREIAERLTLSVRTVEGHIYRAKIKFDAASRHDLARAVWGEPLLRRGRKICPDCPYLAPSGTDGDA